MLHHPACVAETGQSAVVVDDNDERFVFTTVSSYDG